MRIAIPLAEGRLCMHFGHCQEFALIGVDRENKAVLETRMATPPPHAPGLLPQWLGEQGVDLVIAGGMGSRAQALFQEGGIGVITGAPGQTPDELVQAYLDGTLATGDNVCDH
jgi:ATP-binding protein involved in chromosome partitioning